MVDKNAENNRIDIQLFAKEHYSTLLNLSQKITQNHSDSIRQGATLLHTLLFQVSSLSLAAVGFSIPIIGKSSVVNTQVLFIVGLFLLTAAAIWGLFYSAVTIQNSILDQNNGFIKNQKIINEGLKDMEFLLENSSDYGAWKRYKNKTQNRNNLLEELSNINHDKVVYMLISIFSLGIVCVFLSIFKISLF